MKKHFFILFDNDTPLEVDEKSYYSVVFLHDTIKFVNGSLNLFGKDFYSGEGVFVKSKLVDEYFLLAFYLVW